MTQHNPRSHGAFTLVLLLGFLIFTVFPANHSSADRRPAGLVQPKTTPVISAASARILDRMETNGQVKIWVFFTDKGVLDEQSLAAASRANAARITSKAAQRRAKMGIREPGLADLPVTAGYIQAIGNLGGQLRRTSRWLNAASFMISRAELDRIARLPFVREIRPVIRYTSPRIEITAQPLYKPTQPAEPGPLDYGASSGQLTMIGVTAAHSVGYDGAGVLVCMMDTGYRKDHTAFGNAFSEGRVWAEWDFIFNDGNTQNEAQDIAGQHNHGTYTWSTLGGVAPGNLYGPAYKSNFILAKTEDMRSETPIEEDNWVAGMEWADSIGADVISSSLGYSDWYTQSDFDGNTCVTTIAADIAASLGIVVCNSAGNGGPAASTLNAPADADSIVTVGAVSSSGVIASFSSRGPTYDGRIKPEVCAQGVNTRCASPATTTDFTYASGTSLSCPLLGGAAALVIQAHPGWTPMQVRTALMQTAGRAATPDNTYGWGIIDVMAAINYNQCDCTNFGDCDADGAIGPVDVVIMVNYVYKGSGVLPALPSCDGINGDWNCDGNLNPVDIVRIVNHVYQSGPGPCNPCACTSYPTNCP